MDGDEIYYPWGQQWKYDNEINSWRQFYGNISRFQVDLGLYRTSHRFYSPDFARWLSPDPLGGNVMNPQSFNRYAYALNNPATFNDPPGLQASCPNHENCKAYGESYGRGYAEYEASCGINGCENMFGSGETCYMDGMLSDCGIVFGAMSSGAANECPNNNCEGMLIGPHGIFLPVNFQASDGAADGYWTCEMQGVYGSINTAGEAAVGCAADEGAALNLEMYGNLYQMANGQYSFNLPQVGGATSSPFDPTMIPTGTSYYGNYHTHPSGPGYLSERFSGTDGDIGVGESAGNQGRPMYLGTPAGRIEVFSQGQASQFPWGCVLVGPPVSPGAASYVPVPSCP